MSFGVFPGALRSGRRRRSPIAALEPPQLGMLLDGDVIAAALSAGVGDTSNYTSTAGSIAGVTVSISVDGSGALAGDTVVFGSFVMLVVAVTDTAGNARVWTRLRSVAGIAPGFATAPSAALIGRTVTFLAGVAEGVPAPAVSVSQLLLDGIDVLQNLEGLTYGVPDSDAESLLAWTVTATNPAGSASVSGSLAVAANQEPPGPEPGEWTLEGAVYLGQSPALSGSDMRTVEFSADGMRAFAVFRGTQVIRQYDLDAPWNIPSANAAGDGAHDFSGYIATGTRGDSVAHGLFIRKDTGATAWLWNRTEVFELTLGTPWDITTATNTGYLDLGATMSRGHDLDWKADGTRWFVEDRQNGRVYQFDCSTPWDIETSVAAGSYAIPNVNEVRGIDLQPDGARMFLMHTSAQEAREYALATPWDVTTASLTRSFDVSGQSGDPRSIVFRPDGTAFFVGDATSRRVHVYAFDAPPPPPGHGFDVATAEGGVTVEWSGEPADFTITSAEGGVTIEWDE